MSVSGVQQSDSVIHIHVSILFQILLPFRLLRNTEQCSLCYTVALKCNGSPLSQFVDSAQEGYSKYLIVFPP